MYYHLFSSKRADFAIGALSINEQEEVVDFTHPYYEQVGHIIIMRSAKQPVQLFKGKA